MANRLESVLSQFHALQNSVVSVLQHKPDAISPGLHRKLLPYDTSPNFRIAELVIQNGSTYDHKIDVLGKNFTPGISLKAIGRKSQHLILENGDRKVVLPHEAFCFVHGLILANCPPQTYT